MEWVEQEALLDSYHSARKGRLERWRYRMRVAEAAVAYKEGDEAGKALFGETEDEAEDNGASDKSPLRWRRRGPAPPRSRGANNKAEDTAGYAEGPPHQHRGGGPTPPRPRSANNEAEDIAGSAEAPPCRQRGGGFPPLRQGTVSPATTQRT